MDDFLVHNDALDQRGVKEALAFLLHQLNILYVGREAITSLLDNMVNCINCNIRKVFRCPSKGLSAHRGHRDLPKRLSVF